MLENSFIQFFDSIQDECSSIVMPVTNGCVTLREDYDAQSKAFAVFDKQEVELPVELRMDDEGNHYSAIIIDGIPAILGGSCFRIRLDRNTETQYGREISKGIEVDSDVEENYIGYVVFAREGKYKVKFSGTVEAVEGHHQDEISATAIGTLLFCRKGEIEGDSTIKIPIPQDGSIDTSIEIEAYDQDEFDIYIAYQYNWDDDLLCSIDMSISIDRVEGESKYSNLLRFNNNVDDFSIVEYWCDEAQFGFPLGGVAHQKLLLPIRLKNPQYKQEDKTYEKLNGENIVLYAKFSKEYDLMTEYIPESWHDKIMIALACDHVLINGKSVQKSNNYEIDWENYTFSECGDKLVKAECKVIENLVQRNSNY